MFRSCYWIDTLIIAHNPRPKVWYLRPGWSVNLIVNPIMAILLHHTNPRESSHLLWTHWVGRSGLFTAGIWPATILEYDQHQVQRQYSLLIFFIPWLLLWCSQEKQGSSRQNRRAGIINQIFSYSIVTNHHHSTWQIGTRVARAVTASITGDCNLITIGPAIGIAWFTHGRTGRNEGREETDNEKRETHVVLVIEICERLSRCIGTVWWN